jgi:hypothetical protein
LCETITIIGIVPSEQNLANFIKQNTQQKGFKRNEKRGPKSKQAKNTNPKQVTKGKGTNCVSKFTPIARSILKKKG